MICVLLSSVAFDDVLAGAGVPVRSLWRTFRDDPVFELRVTRSRAGRPQ